MSKDKVILLIVLMLGVYYISSSWKTYSENKPGRYQIIVKRDFKNDGTQQCDRIYLLDSSTGKTWYTDGREWFPFSKHY